MPEAHIQSYDDAVRALLAEQNLDADVCNILVAHQFVTGAGITPERSDSEVVTVGGVDNVDCAAFAAFDYVALGHIHGPQPVGGRCRYAGSPLPYSFSEANQDKSITVIQVDAAHTCSISTLPLTPLHPMRELRGPLEELLRPDIVAAADPADYLRVTLTDEREPENAASRLRAVYPNLMRLEFDNQRTRQSDLQLDEGWEEERHWRRYLRSFLRSRTAERWSRKARCFWSRCERRRTSTHETHSIDFFRLRSLRRRGDGGLFRLFRWTLPHRRRYRRRQDHPL